MIVLPSGASHLNDNEIARVFEKKIQPHFKFDISGRISIKSDVNQFKLDDKFVWNQARGRLPHYHEVYWDGVWVCDFKDSDHTVDTLNKFFLGFANAYEAGQVSLNTKHDIAIHEAQIAVQKEVEAQRLKGLEKASSEIEKMSEATPEDKMAKEVLKEIVDEKKKFKQKRKRI